jgi:hypothetical protein
MNPEQPFYLLDDGMQPIPLLFYPMLNKCLALPLLASWTEYLWFRGREKNLIASWTTAKDRAMLPGGCCLFQMSGTEWWSKGCSVGKLPFDNKEHVMAEPVTFTLDDMYLCPYDCCRRSGRRTHRSP